MNEQSIILFMSCPFSYARLYKDVRDAIDLCHWDRTLEQEVAKDPGRLNVKSSLACFSENIVLSKRSLLVKQLFLSENYVHKLHLSSMDSWWSYSNWVTFWF